MKLIRRIHYLLRQKRLEGELAEELEFHRAMKQNELRRQGIAPEDAVFAARRELGNITGAREESRGIWIWPWIESVWQDVSYAVRNLRRQPGFTLIAAGALAAAIALNTSLFTVFNAIALRPWPVRDPAHIVTVFHAGAGAFKGNVGGFSLAEFRYLAAHTRSLSGLVAMRQDTVRLGFEDVGKRTGCLFVSGNYFHVLGVAMDRGRAFLPEEDRLDAPEPVAILSHRLWQNHFGADPEIIGKQARVDDIPFTVVGVASSDFTGMPGRDYLWIPFAAVPLLRPEGTWARDFLHKPGHCCSDVAGRLARGVTRDQAQAELELLSRQFGSEFALESNAILLAGTTFFARPDSKRKVVPVFVLMFLGVTLVLLLACANVGNLLLARAASRSREIAVRISLGAGRGRLIRQLLTESLVLALAAAALGVLFAWKLPMLVLDRIGEAPPFRLAPDMTVLGYALALGVLACIAFGLAPALHGTRSSVSGAMKEQAFLPGVRLALRELLLSVQVAVAIVLLTGAGLMVRGVSRARTQDPGFAVGGIDVVTFELPVRSYDPPRLRAFSSQLLKDLEGAQDLAPYGLAAQEPLSNSRNMTWFRKPGEDRDQQRVITLQQVSAGYFDVLRIPIVAGRNFTPADAGSQAILINETMARRYWPGGDALGKSIVSGGTAGSNPYREIIGIVKDAYTTGLDEIEPMFYQQFTGSGAPKLLIRHTPGSSAAIAAVATRIDPRIRLQAAPLQDGLDRWLAPSRIGAELAGILGGVALALATIGMLGVFAYVVQRRTQEIGIRVALGAQPGQVIRLVLAGNSRAVLAGLVAGFLGAAAGSRLIERYLFGISPLDPLTYLLVAAILALAGVAASYFPARRAARVDPVVALRYE